MLIDRRLNSVLEQKCVEHFHAFAHRWEIETTDHTVTKRDYEWRLLRRSLTGVLVEFVSVSGSGTAGIGVFTNRPNPTGNFPKPPLDLAACTFHTTMFWYKPATSCGIMLPPWEALPGSTRFTQGLQEAYRLEWSNWFEDRTHQEKLEYAEKYPVPESVLVLPEYMYGQSVIQAIQTKRGITM